MAEVPYGPVMKPSTDAPPKREFAANITNKDTTTSPPKRQKTESPPDEFVGGWSAADLSSSEPHSDATIEGTMARQTYGFPLVVQLRHSSEIASSTEFYVHKAPNAVDAVQARRSGALLTFVPTPEQPLEQMPTGGGVSHVNNVSKISSDVVGVNEGLSAAAKKAHEVIARKKQARGTGSTVKGETRAPSFSVWFDDKLVGKYKGNFPASVPDIRHKHPGEYMNQRLLSCLLGVNKTKLLKSKTLKEAYDVTKFTAEYVDD